MTIQEVQALADSAFTNLKRSGETSLSFRIEYNREIPNKDEYVTYKKQQAEREMAYAILLLQRKMNEQIVLFNTMWSIAEGFQPPGQNDIIITEQITIHVKTLAQVLRILSS